MNNLKVGFKLPYTRLEHREFCYLCAKRHFYKFRETFPVETLGLSRFGFLRHPQSIWQPYLAFPKTSGSNRQPVREKIKIEDGRLDGENKTNARLYKPGTKQKATQRYMCVNICNYCKHGTYMQMYTCRCSCMEALS